MLDAPNEDPFPAAVSSLAKRPVESISVIKTARGKDVPPTHIVFTDGLEKQTTKLSLAILSPCTELALLYVPLETHLFALYLLLPFPQAGLSLFFPLP